MNDILEEKNIYYKNMTLDDAKELIYYLNNIGAFVNSKIVEISLDKNESNIKAEGLLYNDKENKLFDMEIRLYKKGLVIYSVILNINNKKDFYAIDKFYFREKDIKIKSSIEGKGEFIKTIPYYEKQLNLK